MYLIYSKLRYREENHETGTLVNCDGPNGCIGGHVGEFLGLPHPRLLPLVYKHLLLVLYSSFVVFIFYPMACIS